jgi:hypothetical protein
MVQIMTAIILLLIIQKWRLNMYYKTFKEDKTILNVRVVYYKHHINAPRLEVEATYPSLYHAKRDIYGNEKGSYFKWEVLK